MDRHIPGVRTCLSRYPSAAASAVGFRRPGLLAIGLVITNMTMLGEAATTEAPALRSGSDPASEAFKRNAAEHGALAAELRERLAAARLGGSEQARRRHTERGKLLPRERVDTLVDPGSPFLELSPPAADGMYDGEAPGAGIITGVGRVSGAGVRDRRQ